MCIRDSPIVERISRDPQWEAITSQLMVNPGNGDIILVPLIRGHVVNLGDTADIDDKLARVMTMYRKVLPLKGWEYYDTISVKWAGQVVASRRVKSIPEPAVDVYKRQLHSQRSEAPLPRRADTFRGRPRTHGDGARASRRL